MPTGVRDRALRSTLARGERVESTPRRPGERSFPGERLLSPPAAAVDKGVRRRCLGDKERAFFG